MVPYLLSNHLPCVYSNEQMIWANGNPETSDIGSDNALQACLGALQQRFSHVFYLQTTLGWIRTSLSHVWTYGNGQGSSYRIKVIFFKVFPFEFLLLKTKLHSNSLFVPSAMRGLFYLFLPTCLCFRHVKAEIQRVYQSTRTNTIMP